MGRAVIGVLHLRQLPDYLVNGRRSKTLALLMPSQPLSVLLPTFRHEVSTTNGRAAQTRSLTPILGSALTQLAPEVGGTALGVTDGTSVFIRCYLQSSFA